MASAAVRSTIATTTAQRHLMIVSIAPYQVLYVEVW